MGRFNYLQNNFIFGECSPGMLGHSDQKEYANMCQAITNGFVKKQGGTTRRPGTQYKAKQVAGVNIPAASRLFPFVFSKHESYMVVVTSDSTIGTKGFTVINCSTGTEATITDGRAVASAAVGGHIFTGYDTYGGLTVLQKSQYAQNGDLLCIVNEKHVPTFLVRTAADTFVLTDIWKLRNYLPIYRSNLYSGSDTTILLESSKSGSPAASDTFRCIPYRTLVNGLDFTGSVGATITAGGTALGAQTYTLSSGQLAVGTMICINGSGYATISSNTGAHTGTMYVTKVLPDTTADSFTLGAWSTNYGWPRTVCFYQQRIIYGGNTAYPDSLWGSQQGDILEIMVLRPSDDANFSSLSNDRPFDFTLAQTEINEIQWLATDKDLYVGTGGKELIAYGNDPTLSLGPLNIGFAEQTAFGSEQIQAKISDGTVHFVQRGGLSIREMIYEFRENKRIADDMNKYADHIVKKGLNKRASYAVPKIAEIAYQALEHNITWCRDTNNCLFGLTRNRHEGVMAWHWHELGGVVNSTEIPQVVSIACAPSPDNDYDDLWMLVTRTINSATVTYLEKMGKPYRFSSVSNSSTDIKDKLVMADCAVLQHLGSPGNTFNGFTHLTNMTVDCFADGFYLGQITVDNTGTITLPGPSTYTNLVAGLPYNTLIKPFPVTAGAIMGSADSVPKRIDRAIFRFQDTIRALFGKNDDASLEAIEFRDNSIPNGTPTPMFTGVKRKMYDGPIEEDADIIIKCDQALPFTLTSLTLRGNTYEG